MNKAQIELIKRIKKAFDPKGILNPRKIFERSTSEIETPLVIYDTFFSKGLLKNESSLVGLV
jgi:hypothetical protein